ncbi:MAG: 16S rRNA methyltransferase [Candidatus Brockarchaeota archaeon]|nr:16S rRNA methyltransferase [Candidatus Brockarchaeota archaeon]
MKSLICFFDSSLELVPREIAAHPQVVKNAVKKGKSPLETMLERSIHHKAILRLENSWKRGRPDILHTCLKIVSDSPVYRAGKLGVVVHTVAGKWIVPRERIRFPVTYGNFIGLMEKLLSKGRILGPGGRILMETVSKKDALRVLDEYPRRILFTHVGRMVEIRDYVKSVSEDGVPTCFLIGAYPRGRPSDEIWSMTGEKVSVYEGVLAAWTVAAWLTYEIFHLHPC